MSDPLQFLMFKNTLRELGYNDQAHFTSGQSFYKRDIVELGELPFYFISYVIEFKNKESYLWYRYMDFQQEKPNTHYTSLLKEFASSLCMEEDTRVGEAGWEVKYSVHPSKFTAKERSKIMLTHSRNLRKYIKEGYGAIAPAEGDILTSYPYGSNITMLLGIDSWIKGKEQRAQFGKLLGFGETKENGWNYGRYNSNLNLRPI